MRQVDASLLECHPQIPGEYPQLIMKSRKQYSWFDSNTENGTILGQKVTPARNRSVCMFRAEKRSIRLPC